MYCVRNVTSDLYWVGANDHRLALFENCFPIPRGVSYNAYCLLDEKTVLFDTVDWSACRQLLENLNHVLNGRELDYLLINHLEPDHAACIEEILLRHPKVKVISNEKAFMLMRQFGFHVDDHECIEVKEGDTFSFGRHTVTFVGAPMVHWPEAMVTFDLTDGVLFSADAFGTFGALDGKLFADEVDFDRDVLDEARRYYANIVGKYGAQVQALLKKAATLDIEKICALHGPVLSENLAHYLDLYNKWSSYVPEKDGVMIAYASIYGNTKKAAELLYDKLKAKNVDVIITDLARCDMSKAISDAFAYGKLVLATPTYNADVFPFMRTFIEGLTERNYQKRTVAFIENGSWAPWATKAMKGLLEGCKNLVFAQNEVKILSAMNEENKAQIENLANELAN